MVFAKGCIPFNKGKELSDKHKKSLSISHIGLKFTPEQVEKRASKLRGKKRPVFSKEWLENMSLASKKRFADKTKHPRWIEDRSQLKIEENKAYDTKYKYWMLEVKKRDGWKCRIDNCDCSGRLEAHHILNWKDHPELRYNINNGITLCLAHHPRKKDEAKRLIPFFTAMVEVKS